MVKQLLLWPAQRLSLVIPVTILAGLLVGFAVRVPQTPALQMPAILLMVFPIMIGVPWKEVVSLKPARLLGIATFLNFLVIPVIAWLLGRWLLGDYPSMMVGLVIAALLPTSGMTISWTGLSGGNVSAAIRLTVISLVAGSLLLPFYLLVLAGAQVKLDLLQTFLRVGMMVLLPMLLGTLAYRLILQRRTPQQFQQEIKPLLPGVSTWAMLYIIFLSTASRATNLVTDLRSLAAGLATLLLFYLLNFLISTLAGRWFLSEADSYTLVYSTVLRNLSIALGLAMATAGAEAAFLVTVAFLLQVQGAAWYGRFVKRYRLFERGRAVA